MNNAIECSEILMERILQNDKKLTDRKLVKRLLRQIRDWWNVFDSHSNYDEVKERIEQQRLKYQSYRAQL